MPQASSYIIPVQQYQQKEDFSQGFYSEKDPDRSFRSFAHSLDQLLLLGYVSSDCSNLNHPYEQGLENQN